MNPTKQKAPGSTPRPSKTRETASAVPRPNELVNSGTATAGEQVNRPEAFYLATLGHGEVVEASVSRAQTAKEAAFEYVDHYTLDLMLKAGLAEQVSLYLLLSEYSRYEGKYGTTHYYTVTRAELAKRLYKSESTVSRWLSKLEAHGFISTYYQRQTESPGVSRVAGNAYVLEHRSMRGRETAIYQEPLVETANSEPMTQSTEAALEVVTKTATMAIGLEVLSTPNRPLSSSTATATSTTSYSNLTTPLVKNDELVITLRDLDRDLFKPDGKKSSDLSKRKGNKASKSQLEQLSKYLGGYKRAALKLYEVEALSELSSESASDLIQHTLGKKPELTNRLNRLERELRDKAESEGRAREAATQAQRDYEGTQSYKAEQLSIYGRELTEAEIAGRMKLIRAQLREKAPGELRARGKKLKEVEADTSLTPSERLSHLLELING